jgi:hypothetical protein
LSQEACPYVNRELPQGFRDAQTAMRAWAVSVLSSRHYPVTSVGTRKAQWLAVRKEISPGFCTHVRNIPCGVD